MAEWLYEAGIGEARAALVDGGRIVEAHIEVDGGQALVGTVADARLRDVLIPGRRGIAELASGDAVLIEPLDPAWTLGGLARIEVVREALHETRATKRAVARPAPGKDPVGGATLRDRLTGPVREIGAHDADALEAAGWSECLEAAESGVVGFDGGTLFVSATPAMTLIDVDGWWPPAELALAAATEVAHVIRRWGIGGSIGIDFPTVEGKAERLAVAATIDAVLPQPFERTALNGFGFLQIVRPRPRMSLGEAIRADATGHAARTLLRRAERSGLVGGVVLSAHPRVAAAIEARPEWIERLARHLGGSVTLQPEAMLAISGGYVAKA